MAATLEHPHVVPVYEAGEHDGSLFIAMRFIDGRDLATEVRDHGRVAPDRLGRIVAQVAGALDAAHRSGVVHRDVKPANVLLTGAGDDEQAYLTDFGLTREAASESGLTLTGQWVGTVDYAAPEQILGEPTDARSDVYALGCLAFQALTGKPPYLGAPAARLFAHMNEPPPSACAVRPELQSDVDATLARAMAKKPADRFQSAGDLGRALAAGLAGRAQVEPERTVARGAALTGVPPAGAPTDPDATRARPAVNADAAGAAPPTDPDATRIAAPAAAGPTRVQPSEPETTRAASRREPLDAYAAPETTLVAPAPGAPPAAPTVARGRQPRVLAGIALVLIVAVAAVITLVASGGGGDTSYADQAKDAVKDLARANQTLSDRFTSLSPGTQRATIVAATGATATAAATPAGAWPR